MSGVAIVRNLLANNSNVTAQVPNVQIFAGPLPDSLPIPALSVMEIATTEIPTINATAPTTLVEALVQITVVAASYPTLKSLHALVRKAVNYQRGTIAGFAVVSIRRMANGPDFGAVDAKFQMQTLDVRVIYYEPN